MLLPADEEDGSVVTFSFGGLNNQIKTFGASATGQGSGSIQSKPSSVGMLGLRQQHGGRPGQRPRAVYGVPVAGTGAWLLLAPAPPLFSVYISSSLHCQQDSFWPAGMHALCIWPLGRPRVHTVWSPVSCHHYRRQQRIHLFDFYLGGACSTLVALSLLI